ncbi:MAG: undecaprenyl-diphosphate phosphatase [Ruminococcus sp.]
MSVFEAIIQGIVQGLTEFLPVSSSGHLAITQHIMGNQGEENLFFNVMLHIGTLVAVVAFYHKLIYRLIKEFCFMVKDIFTGKFKWSEINRDRNLIMMLIIGLLPLFLLFLPIPGTDMKIKDLADVFNQQAFLSVVAASLLVTSALLYAGIKANDVTTLRYKKKGILTKKGAGRHSFNVVDAVCVGLGQFAAAVFPGLSRSGTTLAIGELRGINKQTALDYTFVLAIPSIVAAALLETKDAISAPGGISIDILPVIIGMVTAAVVGYLSIVIFKWFLKTDKTIIFVIYTAAIGLIMLSVSIIEMFTRTNLFTGLPL